MSIKFIVTIIKQIVCDENSILLQKANCVDYKIGSKI